MGPEDGERAAAAADWQPATPGSDGLLASHHGAVGAASPAAGEWRVVWASRFGTVLIEVRNGVIFVNGQRVEPAVSPSRPGA